jgi:serine protease Do
MSIHAKPMEMMFRLSVLFPVFLFLAGCDQPVQSQQNAFLQATPSSALASDSLYLSRSTAITRAVERASPAVVSISVTQVQQIRARDPFWDTWMEFMYGRQRNQLLQRQVQSAGSGFIISADGYVVTNEHVAAGASQIAIALPDGTTFDARLIGTDTATDLALLKVDTDVPLPFVEFDLASEPIVGEWVIALGNPFGLFEATDPTVTVGVVSATNRDLTPQGNRFYLDMIQTDAAINRGNSGGPLLNALGQVIGVNTAIYSESGGSIGIGFAVPAQRVYRVLEELRENGFVDRSYFTGLSGRSVTAQIAQALGMDAARGVFVEEVEANSPAARAGFQPYDVIQFLEGERVSTRDEFVARLFEYRPGDTVQITVLRQAELVDLTLTIGSSR